MSDAELVSRIGAGGPEGRAAETDFVRRFAPRVRLYGLRHLRDEERARDLVQGVMLAVIEAARARRLVELDKVDRFVLGTSRNVAQRMRESDARATPTPLDELPAILDEAVEHVDARSLMHCLEQLEARAREVVRLSFMDEQPADIIARDLATTPGNVRVLRHRAIGALRRCLDAREATP